ncbi:LamG-like jellyroll fold domain-containing protein, partial [Actinotalea subterranea]|uniref:LamG-like jellyroll fold domain-containing protein n=1 Tax=Actinotalea subterranea TaxID=2607497 RepID=UPI0011EE744E
MHARQRFRPFVALAAAAVLTATVLVASPAHADTAPADPTLPTTVTADGLPTAQINGVVWSQVIVGNTVYVGGNFTKARPAGAAPGTNEVNRSHLLAYDLTTGVLISSFAPTLNGQVKDLTVSPDGTTLYAAGQFTQVNGQNRYRVAAFDTSTGALSSTFRPTINATVNAVSATNTTVYVAGSLTSVNKVARTKLAALDASTGATLPFAATLTDGTINAMTIAPDGGSVVIGGSFTTVNGSSNPGYGLARLDGTTGDLMPLPANTYARNAGTNAAILSLETDGENFYGAGFHFGGAGNIEGSFAADWDTGSLVWVEDCHGDTYSAFPAGGAVYQASHKHYCGNTGGFPQTDPWSYYRATAVTKVATGVNTPDIYGYPDHDGEPAPTILNWYPTINAGTFTGKTQGPWTVSGNDDYVLMGGEFTQVNGVAQQGLVRFAVSDIAPDSQGPVLSGSSFPLVGSSFAAGTVRLTWKANYDRDNATLTYRVYRTSLDSTPVYEETRTASFWNLPTMGFMDTGLTPGSNQRYRLEAVDPFGNVVRSNWITVPVSTEGELSSYAQTVLDDDPVSYWRLGEDGGALSPDWAGWSDLTVGSGVTRGLTGAIGDDSDTASSFDGTSAGLASTSTAEQGRQTFAVEAWIRTTTTAGGKIVGFGNASSGSSTSYDRHVYMEPDGRVVFGVYPGGVRTVTSGEAYNDGEWHHVVASLGPDGMVLSIDGARVAQRSDTTSAQGYSGYWRIGGDSPWSGAAYFDGDIDEVALYGAPLSAQQVNAHYVASGRTSELPAAPADAYGAAVYGASPDLYWRLGESSGTVARDAGLLGNDGTYIGGVTLGAPGALPSASSTAVTTDGAGGGVVSARTFTNPTVYSEELWFSTTTTAGGKLIGFGDAATGTSSNYDRHVYMETDGRLTFGVWTGAANTITTAGAFNDGAWHHMVATQGPGGMSLYVDGVLQGTHPQTAAQSYTGRWRAGGDTTWGPQPWFAGTIDEVAVYPHVLSASTVASHYTLGTGTAPVNQAPVAAFTATATDLSVSVDASGSSDPDGTVAGFAWDFGDGATAS